MDATTPYTAALAALRAAARVLGGTVDETDYYPATRCPPYRHAVYTLHVSGPADAVVALGTLVPLAWGHGTSLEVNAPDTGSLIRLGTSRPLSAEELRSTAGARAWGEGRERRCSLPVGEVGDGR